MDQVRRCPQCGAEYRPEILRCADCGVELELRWEEEDPRFAPPESSAEMPPESEPPPGDYRSLYSSGEITDLQPLVDGLRNRGIPFRIDVVQLEPAEASPRPRARYDLLVRREEREAATEALSRLGRGELTPELLVAVDRDFDPQRGYSRCPACSASLPDGVEECPDCGLVLGTDRESAICSACGGGVGPADDVCPHCGERMEE